VTRTLTATLPGPVRPEGAPPALVVLAGPPGVAGDRVVPLGLAPCVLGREPDVDDGAALEVADARVSRRHASVGLDPDHPGWVVLHDLGSKNGTFVDGRPAARALLAGGEVVRVGETLLLVTRDRAATSGAGSPLLGRSSALEAVRGAIEAAAACPLPVLVLGETGVGKEVVAREVHARSGRPGPFRAVNCAAIPRDLAESTLFGHRKGAFTGATDASSGLVRAAHRGTLLLDEVGELDPALQAKLLRVLEEGTVLPVGAVDPVAVDVRFVAATNRDLFEAAQADGFRDDLLARLAGQVVRVPPLRERRDDVAPLLAAFLGVDVAALGARVEADALEALLLYDWPRNVRELEVFARRVASRPGRLSPGDLEPQVRAALEAARAEPLLDATCQTRGSAPSKAELEAALHECGDNLAEVARRFGRDRRQIYRWLERHGLARP